MAVTAHARHYGAAWHSLLVEGDVDHVLARLERHEADGEARVPLRRHLRWDILAAGRDRDLQVPLAGLTRVDYGQEDDALNFPDRHETSEGSIRCCFSFLLCVCVCIWFLMLLRTSKVGWLADTASGYWSN